MLTIEYHRDVADPTVKRRLYNRVLNEKTSVMVRQLNPKGFRKSPTNAHVTPSGAIVFTWADDSHEPVISRKYEGEK